MPLHGTHSLKGVATGEKGAVIVLKLGTYTFAQSSHELLTLASIFVSHHLTVMYLFLPSPLLLSCEVHATALTVTLACTHTYT